MSQPMPCRHCGFNFMKPTNDVDAPNLCNNCILADQRRTPKKGETKVETIDILIKCPHKAYAKLEEHCIKEGKTINNFILYALLRELEWDSIKEDEPELKDVPIKPSSFKKEDPKKKGKR